MRGASDATYIVNAFGDELLMQLQLNVHRLVVAYSVPRSMRSMLVLGSSQMIQFIRLRAAHRAVSSQSDVNHLLLLSTRLSFRMVNKEAYLLTRFNWVKDS